MEKAVSTKTVNIINALIFLIAGILFCVSTSLGEKWIGLVIGIGVLLIGLITVIGDFTKEKCLISRAVIVGSVITALGIYLIVERGFVGRILGLVPYILIAAGVCVFIDAFLLRFVRGKRSVPPFVAELIVGLALIVFGILLLTVSSFKQRLGLVFGVALIVYACYLLIDVFAKKKYMEKKSSDKKSK